VDTEEQKGEQDAMGPTGPGARPVRIAAVGGSVRPGNYTRKALAVCMDELGRMEDVEAEVFDPSEMILPFPGVEMEAPGMQTLFKAVKSADGVILSTPLYNGSYSCVIKTIIDNLGYPSVLGGKPVGIVGVAASPYGAARAIDHLAEICAYIGAQVLPENVSVAKVWEVFDEAGRCKDADVEESLRALPRALTRHAQRFQEIG
jgi:NAD(P)H-dependent FMN reductase